MKKFYVLIAAMVVSMAMNAAQVVDRNLLQYWSAGEDGEYISFRLLSDGTCSGEVEGTWTLEGSLLTLNCGEDVYEIHISRLDAERLEDTEGRVWTATKAPDADPNWEQVAKGRWENESGDIVEVDPAADPAAHFTLTINQGESPATVIEGRCEYYEQSHIVRLIPNEYLTVTNYMNQEMTVTMTFSMTRLSGGRFTMTCSDGTCISIEGALTHRFDFAEYTYQGGGYDMIEVATTDVEVVESRKTKDRCAQRQKLLIDGQLYLMYEGKMYDVRGAQVK